MYSGSTFGLLYDFVADKNAGRPTSLIQSQKLQDQLQDIADVLTELAPFAVGSACGIDLNMGAHVIGGLGTSNQNDSAATVKQTAGQVGWAGTFGGTADALTATIASCPAAFDGLELWGLISATNTVATPTLNLNGAGAVNIVDYKANTLGAATLVTPMLACFKYVSGAWRLLSTSGGNVAVATDKTLQGNGNGVPLTTILTAETVTFAASVSLDFTPTTKSPVKEITLTGNCSIAATNLTAGETIVIRLIQDATGGRQVTSWGSEFVWLGGNAPNINTAADGVTIVTGLVRDSTHIDMAMATGGSANMTVQVFTASGTWTRPDGCRRVRVRCVGGGGGGGGAIAAASQLAVGSGGGCGGYGEGWYDVTGTSSATVTVGAAGTAGANTGTAGGTGGTTSFGSLMSVPGGGGGQVMATGTSQLFVAGGALAGAITGADINSKGMIGDWGLRLSGTLGFSGRGGSSPLGGGGQGRGSAADGIAGSGYGGGGGGGLSSSATGQAGGAGSAGVVVVEEYY